MKIRKPHATLSICAKVSDRYSHVIYDKHGKIYREYNGYVPSFLPGQHHGNYLLLDIDPYTGRILNWKPWKRKRAKS